MAERMLDLIAEAHDLVASTPEDSEVVDVRTVRARRRIERLEVAVHQLLEVSAGTAAPARQPKAEAPAVFVACGSCDLVGAYHSPRHRVVRCRYCRASVPADPGGYDDLVATAAHLGRDSVPSSSPVGCSS